MQPYLFPYLGYWELIKAVDKFLILDDVHYIKQGWINRNRIIVNGAPSWLTIPIKNQSSHKKIHDLEIVADPAWRKKSINSIYLSYKASPYFDEIFPIISKILSCNTENLSCLLRFQIEEIGKLLGLNAEILPTARMYATQSARGQDRVIGLCEMLQANTYINLPGGELLYKKEDFSTKGLELKFVSPRQIVYHQPRTDEFIPNLSIVDVLMNIGKDGVISHLKESS
jgi:hypothetical protein